MKGYGENSQPAATSDEYRKGYDKIFVKKENTCGECLHYKGEECGTSPYEGQERYDDSEACEEFESVLIVKDNA